MKKQKLFRILIALTLAAALLCALPALGLADAGNFAGGSDYGGSSGGGSDWGGSSSSSWSSGGSYSGGGSFSPFSILVLVVIVVVYLIIKNTRKKKGGSSGVSFNAGDTPRPLADNLLAPLRQADPNFSKEALLERVGNMYVQMQQAWEHKQWAPIRMLMTDALFGQFNRQIDEYIQKQQTNHVERIAVLSTEITGYRQDAVNDVLTIRIMTRIIDYVTDDRTGAVISGSKTKELFMTYEWTLIRSKGVQTPKQIGVRMTECPNCGAPVNVNQSGQCEYCSSVLTSGEYDWVISAIRGISQQSR